MIRKRYLIPYLIAVHVMAVGFLLRPAETETVWRTDQSAILRSHLSVDAMTPPGAVLLFGDSLIAGLHSGAIGPDVVNFGIGGNTTDDVLERLPKYTSVARARHVVVSVGVNDLFAKSDEAIAANVLRIVEAIPPGPRITVLGLLPSADQDRPTHIARVNHILRDRVTCDRCTFVDPAETLGSRGTLLPAYDSSDKLHLSLEGTNVLAVLIREAVEPARVARN